MPRKQRTKSDYEDLPKHIGKIRRLIMDGEEKKLHPLKADKLEMAVLGIRRTKYIFKKIYWKRYRQAIRTEEKTAWDRDALYDIGDEIIRVQGGFINWKLLREIQYR
jgi:hypothetical protein